MLARRVLSLPRLLTSRPSFCVSSLSESSTSLLRSPLQLSTASLQPFSSVSSYPSFRTPKTQSSFGSLMASSSSKRSISASLPPGYRLTMDGVNANVREFEYAVRGALVIRAAELGNILARGGEAAAALPFKEIIYCNIGNPQAVGQASLTFPKQLLSLLTYPELAELCPDAFPEDVRSRAKAYLSKIPGGLGAYSNSQGVEPVLNEVAKFIEKRDGYPASPRNIFLTNGASPSVQYMIQMLLRDSSDGIMIPIPQYPLYSATIALCGGAQIHYLLDEEKGWGLSIEELERSFEEAVSKGIKPRALAVINPGNPTGQVLEKENMAEIVEFAHRRGLVLLADEVYQENVYSETKKFHSFKKVLCESPSPIKDEVELVSFHSVSKGFLGECGKRGGYMEIINMHPDIAATVYKMASVNLCPNLVGQLTVGAMVNPPTEGDVSYPLYAKERDAILGSLKQRALLLAKALNTLEGVTCNDSEGAMYAFPQIRLPAKACEEAKKKGVAPDFLYCKEVLENTGICMVPGSGFGQKDGTYHFRTTFLPQPEQIARVVELMTAFHKDFMARYK
mmetsp:Transcript_17148/g.51260  ORF Transcript_17148/g.51260 Transcript_17148/m.51260 type:complete len:565 (-) Transcript_17148:95-1789(-)|eukprot:CAMPEP_0177653040 /NCGR_PEP_ID=MMETSP0447-20121125/13496_1 /TAXON_ID=0 /ORGANISM="Stygamoeba regulata, Strain BSH-02190019" /LENGTH=564 /DNA_ID=CAMNT_0019156415 /DNA_START=82 /DNA_END=1776 /DNA_ORIENTATION=-